MVQKIDINSFDKEVINSDKVTLVDFFADWCGPCRKLSPIIEEIEQELSDKAKFTKINTDENIDLARDYQISGIPTLLVFKNGELVGKQIGALNKQKLKEFIEQSIA